MGRFITQRTSTLAVVKKPEESALTEPTNADQFIAVQPDITLSHNFGNVENEELRNSLMSGQSVVNGQEPSFSMSHYWLGSGKPGAPPVFDSLLEASLGAKRQLTAEVTISATGHSKGFIALSSADAAKFQKGDAILVKDDTNGYRLRPVESTVLTGTTGLNLGFNLPATPSGGSKIEKFTTYYPIDYDLPVLDLWHFMDGGRSGLETLLNGRTTSISISGTAKDSINASYTVEGVESDLNNLQYYFTEVASPNNVLKFLYAKNGDTTHKTASVTLAAKRYTGVELAAEIQTKIRALVVASYDFSEIVVEFSNSSGKFTFRPATANGNKVTYLAFGFGAGGTDKVLGKQLGFNTGVGNPTGSPTGQYEPVTPEGMMTGTYSLAGITPTYSESKMVIAREQYITIGFSPEQSVSADSPTVSFTFDLPKDYLPSISAKSGNIGTIPNSRMATASIQVYLENNDQRFFKKFKRGEKVSFFFGAGQRDLDDNWVPGEVFTIYGSDATIKNFSITPVGTVFALDLEVGCYAPGDNSGSIYCGFQ